MSNIRPVATSRVRRTLKLVAIAICLMSAVSIALGTSFIAGTHWPNHDALLPSYTKDADLTVSEAAATAKLEHLSQIPCVTLGGREESNLCATWLATRASEKSAFWSMISFWVGALGVLGLSINIWHGQAALRRSTESNQLAMDEFDNARTEAAEIARIYRDALSAQINSQRSYVDVNHIRISLDADGTIWRENQFSNMGAVPMRLMYGYWKIRISHILEERPTPFVDAEKLRSWIPPNGTSRVFKDKTNTDPKCIPLLLNGTLIMWLYGKAVFSDRVSGERSSSFCYQLKFGDNGISTEFFATGGDVYWIETENGKAISQSII